MSASARNQPDAALPLVFALLLLTFPTVGALIASRRPENPIGWVFCAVGLVFGIGVFAESYTSYTLHVSSGPLPGVQYAAWFSTWASFPIWFLAATMLYLLFPDGRLPSPRVLWRPLAWTAVISGAISALGEALASDTNHASIANPLAVGGAVGSFLEMAAGFGTALLVSWVISAISLLLRREEAGPVERQQLKWLAYSLLLIVLAISFAPWYLAPPALTLLPIAAGIAILKHRLYDIDRIINRTLVYGALTGILALVYFGGVTATQAVLQAFTDQEELPQLIIVVSTLVIAALFSPLRRRIQSFIDRRFYRSKYDAAKTLAAFNARLREETDLDVLSDDLVEMVRGTVQPEHASLWLRPDREAPGGRGGET